jgi:hypothetical protein
MWLVGNSILISASASDRGVKLETTHERLLERQGYVGTEGDQASQLVGVPFWPVWPLPEHMRIAYPMSRWKIRKFSLNSASTMSPVQLTFA